MADNNEDNNLGIWRAIFDFAQRVGADDPVNMSQTTRQMPEEDRQWLEAAINAYSSQTDPVKGMKEQIRKLLAIDLNNTNDEDSQKGIEALETLKDLCEQFDNAADFHKISGFRILIPLLASSYSPFRANAAELIGNLSQNHEYCQEKLNDCKVLRVLMQLLDKDMDDTVKTKALFAISCMIRSNEKIQSEFISEDGLSYLLRAASSNDPKLCIKTVFLLSELLRKNAEWKRMALSMGMVDQFVSMVGNMDDQGREHVTSALIALITDYPDAIQECRRDDLCLKDILQQRIDETTGKSEYADEQENCNTLLDICWPKE